jgi:hypothetical protein
VASLDSEQSCRYTRVKGYRMHSLDNGFRAMCRRCQGFSRILRAQRSMWLVSLTTNLSNTEQD